MRRRAGQPTFRNPPCPRGSAAPCLRAQARACARRGPSSSSSSPVSSSDSSRCTFDLPLKARVRHRTSSGAIRARCRLGRAGAAAGWGRRQAGGPRAPASAHPRHPGAAGQGCARAGGPPCPPMKSSLDRADPPASPGVCLPSSAAQPDHPQADTMQATLISQSVRPAATSECSRPAHGLAKRRRPPCWLVAAPGY